MGTISKERFRFGLPALSFRLQNTWVFMGIISKNFQLADYSQFTTQQSIQYTQFR
jgi:hypothetical protein